MEDNFLGTLKPIERKGGISQDWLPTPTTIDVPDPLQRKEPGGFFSNLWGGVKDAAKQQLEQVKNDPFGSLQGLLGSISNNQANTIQQNLQSGNVSQQKWAMEEIARLRAEIEAQRGGVNVAGMRIGTMTIIIAVFVVLFVIIIATRK